MTLMMHFNKRRGSQNDDINVSSLSVQVYYSFRRCGYLIAIGWLQNIRNECRRIVSIIESRYLSIQHSLVLADQQALSLPLTCQSERLLLTKLALTWIASGNRFCVQWICGWFGQFYQQSFDIKQSLVTKNQSNPARFLIGACIPRFKKIDTGALIGDTFDGLL